MRTFTSLLVATLLGASSFASAAAPVAAQSGTREARMEAALKDYRAGKVMPAKTTSLATPAVKKPHAGAKARAGKKAHAAKHKVHAAGSVGATAKATPVPAK